MRKITKKWAPILCAMIVILVLAAYLAVFLYAMLEESMGHIAVGILMAVYSLLILCTMVGTILALRQRLREIDSGEEEKAKEY